MKVLRTKSAQSAVIDTEESRHNHNESTNVFLLHGVLRPSGSIVRENTEHWSRKCAPTILAKDLYCRTMVEANNRNDNWKPTFGTLMSQSSLKNLEHYKSRVDGRNGQRKCNWNSLGIAWFITGVTQSSVLPSLQQQTLYQQLQISTGGETKKLT